MANTTTKNLCLSQPKIGQVSDTPEQVLLYTSAQTDTEHLVTIEVPGVDPATIDVQCEQNSLHVTCPRGSAVIPVDPTSDSSKITADIQWGLLTLSIPLPAPAPTHAIKLNVLDAAKKVAAKPAHKEFTGEE